MVAVAQELQWVVYEPGGQRVDSQLLQSASQSFLR